MARINPERTAAYARQVLVNRHRSRLRHVLVQARRAVRLGRMDVRIEEGQGEHEDIERRLRDELQRASELGPPAHQAAFKRAYRRYRRHRLTLGAAAVATVATLLVMVVLVPGRVLTGRGPATALPAAHQPPTASPPSSLPFQEPMTLRASPLEGPPGTRIRVPARAASPPAARRNC
jgi:hypothetical protein